MKNILSYKNGSIFTGKEINDWCKDQIKNLRGNIKEAKRIYLHYSFIDNAKYKLTRVKDWHTGYSTCSFHTLGFERIK